MLIGHDQPTLVVLSIRAAMFASYTALGGRHLAWGAVLMGLGINAMHYTGMAGKRMDPAVTYDPWLFLASSAIAIGASAGALWIGFQLSESDRHRTPGRWWPIPRACSR